MKERGGDYLFYSSPLPIGVVAELALHFVKSSKLDHYLSPLPIMDSRVLFYRQRYETLKGEFQKQGIKPLAFHNRRWTQIEPRINADKPFETLKGEFQKTNEINQIGHKQEGGEREIKN